MSSRIQIAPMETLDFIPDNKNRCNEQETTRKEELRRMMYERIAQGNKLAEAEEVARRKVQRL
jgi:hypothetical protein